MNWDAVAAIAELLGAAGVIASLLYLAGQMRAGSLIAKAQAQQAAAAAMRDVTSSLVRDAELNRLMMKSTADWSHLPADDRARLAHLFLQFFKVTETNHHLSEAGLLDRETWDGWCRLMCQYFVTPGWQQYWSVRRDVFSRSFQDFVDSLAPDSPSVTVSDFRPRAPEDAT